jgi:hypothetical protein
VLDGAPAGVLRSGQTSNAFTPETLDAPFRREPFHDVQ